MDRQGDLLIVKAAKLPEDCIRLSHRVLAEGEATGHLHELDSGEVYEKDGILFFKVQERPALLRHPEHRPLSFGPGVYEVISQREYEPLGWRRVAD